MNQNRRRVLEILLAIAGISMAGQAHAKKAAHGEPASADKIYPQLVHISYVQGDVRISRGDDQDKVSKSDWGVTVAGLPVQTGYYLSTGADGRAVIEFEDASTVYLAENSVLAFNDIHSKDDAPFTSIALLTGTLTIDADGSGGAFKVTTPTGGVTADGEKPTYLRLTSYLDGFAVTPLGDRMLQVAGSNRMLNYVPKGQTIYYKDGKQVTPTAAESAANAESSASGQWHEWDKWVDQRVAKRATEMDAVMKQAGIQQPLPGLAALYGKGTFFECKPYGTCWVPSTKKTATEEPVAMNAPRYGGPADPMLAGDGQYPMGWADSAGLMGFDFPCDPYWMWDASVDPMDWPLCTLGTWLPFDNGYAWVAPTMTGTQGDGRHLRYPVHHRPPVRWVRYGGKKAFVPLNPRDVKGKPPLNASHGVFTMRGRRMQQLAYNPREPLRALRSEPGHYLRPVSMRLTQAKPPKPIARNLVLHSHSVAPGHSHLLYDKSTQSFLLARSVEAHGHTSTHVESFVGTAGRLQARAMGIDERGVYHTAMNYGGYRVGRIGPTGGVMRSSSFDRGPVFSGPVFAAGAGGFGGGSFSGGGSMPAASGGPVGSSGGARN